MDSDGKMDRQEFSIAMKLVKLKLQGRNLPSVLPIPMKQLPVAISAPTVPLSARFGKGFTSNLKTLISEPFPLQINLLYVTLSYKTQIGVVFQNGMQLVS